MIRIAVRPVMGTERQLVRCTLRVCRRVPLTVAFLFPMIATDLEGPIHRCNVNPPVCWSFVRTLISDWA